MDKSVETTIRDTFAASKAGSIHFGQVVSALVGAGVESYHIDYRAGRATWYMPAGVPLTLEMPGSEVEIAAAFSATAVKAAILGAQRGEVIYPEFVKLSMAAGCVGYAVWLAGRHVSYYGRKGETHIEHFPS